MWEPDDRIEDRHARKVERVVQQLREHDGSRPISLRKRSVSHRVPKPDDARFTDDRIDVSELDEILEIDPHARICTAEPGVTFDALVRATLRHGLVPTVVPELRTITIGGAVSGCSLESMSFRHGGFHDSCLEYEVITATGEVLTCTPDGEHALVFQMVHGSFGTLGILSKLKFRLVPAKPYVHVLYETHRTLASYEAAIRRHAARPEIDFIDGMIHGPTRMVLCLGRFVDDAPYTHRYDWMRVYYRSTRRRREDWLATPDYFFRYDNGVTNVHPKSFLGRLLLGKLVHSSELLRLVERMRRLLPRARPRVTVDLFIPLSRMQAFMAWYGREMDFYPLWVVPYRREHDYEWIAPEVFSGVDDELFVDLAIYGKKQAPGRNDYRALELALAEIGGLKTLISYNYYSEAEFWRIFDRDHHEAAKRVVDPHGLFRDLYDKTVLAPRGLSRGSPALGSLRDRSGV